MNKALVLSLVVASVIGFSTESFARGRGGRAGGGNEVRCMANALAGEALATDYSMTSVAKAIMARKARGGYGHSICQIVYAPHQIVGVYKGARKGGQVRSLANRIAQMVISKNLVGDCTDWKTKGYHRGGYLRGGNVFHNCRGGRSVAHDGNSRGRSRRQSASIIDSVLQPTQTATLESAVGSGSAAAL